MSDKTYDRLIAFMPKTVEFNPGPLIKTILVFLCDEIDSIRGEVDRFRRDAEERKSGGSNGQ